MRLWYSREPDGCIIVRGSIPSRYVISDNWLIKSSEVAENSSRGPSSRFERCCGQESGSLPFIEKCSDMINMRYTSLPQEANGRSTLYSTQNIERRSFQCATND